MYIPKMSCITACELTQRDDKSRDQATYCEKGVDSES